MQIEHIKIAKESPASEGFPHDVYLGGSTKSLLTLAKHEGTFPNLSHGASITLTAEPDKDTTEQNGTDHYLDKHGYRIPSIMLANQTQQHIERRPHDPASITPAT